MIKLRELKAVKSGKNRQRLSSQRPVGRASSRAGSSGASPHQSELLPKKITGVPCLPKIHDGDARAKLRAEALPCIGAPRWPYNGSLQEHRGGGVSEAKSLPGQTEPLVFNERPATNDQFVDFILPFPAQVKSGQLLE